MEKGTIYVQSENIFPIIKKFLYSDTEIFLRELVSNAVDASQKLMTLAAAGEVKHEVKDLKVSVILDAKKKTITIRDNGIGMTAEEVNKYINEVAFSGAEEFLEKYKDKDPNSIIGHFGLGFYSSFMVSKKVQIQTLSHKKDAVAVQWESMGDPTYELKEIKKEEVGTDIILHIDKDSKEFLEDNKISDLLVKYNKFMPIPNKFGTKEENLPLDENVILDLISKVKCVVTVEEHIRSGGLGTSILELCNDNIGLHKKKIVRLGLPDKFPDQYGSQDSLLNYLGLNENIMVDKMKECLGI